LISMEQVLLLCSPLFSSWFLCTGICVSHFLLYDTIPKTGWVVWIKVYYSTPGSKVWEVQDWAIMSGEELFAAGDLLQKEREHLSSGLSSYPCKTTVSLD
jgi:hypothetical protein